MIMKDLLHGMSYRRVCTKLRDDGISTDEERRVFADDGLSLESKARGNIRMRGSNGTKPVFNLHKNTPNTCGETTFSYPDSKGKKGGASAQFTLTTATIRDTLPRWREMAKLRLWA